MAAVGSELAAEALAARRLGVLGGSFDPPHLGHLHALRAARRAFALDHTVFVPAGRPPHKPDRSLATAEDRIRMLELLLAGEPGCSIWTEELHRSGPSYTVDTVLLLRSLVGESVELFWILGSDNLEGIGGWHRVEELLTLCRPIVVYRRGAGLEPPDSLSREARELLVAGAIEERPEDADSTRLRAQVTDPDAPCPELPPALREYIRERGIYSA